MGVRAPGILLVVAAMSCVQVGAALSVDLFDELGVAGTAWMRLVFAAAILMAITRPRLRAMDPAARRAGIGLGAATGALTLCFFEAVSRLPLGTATALEFLGPLGVAVARRHGGRAGLALPVVAGVGVVCLTEPWTGRADGLGVLFALAAAGGWATYIVLTQRVGDALPGLSGLALSFLVAALVIAPFGLADARGLDADVAVRVAGLAVLMPLVPFALEMVALRRLNTAAFGTLMSLEPAFGTLAGLVVLSQEPRVLAVIGVALVVVAGIGAQRRGSRGAPVAAHTSLAVDPAGCSG